MVSEVSVCNSALAKIGADRITALTDGTKAAIILNELFEQIRDEVLRSHPWNFAKKRVELTQDATTPAFGYAYRYALPSDCLRVLATEYDDTEYVIESDSGIRYILTDEDTMKILYIQRITDPTMWDAMFCEALAWRLAESVVYALTQSSSLLEQVRNGYKDSIKFARSMNGQEGTLKGIVADTWTNARY